MAYGTAVHINNGTVHYWSCNYSEGIKYNLVNTDITYEAWLKADTASSTLAWGKLEDRSGDWAFYHSGTALKMLIYHSGGSQVITITDPFDTTSFHHFAVVYDNTADKFYCYYDGVLANAGGTAAGGIFPESSISKFWIGRCGTIAGDMYIDEFRVSNNKRYTSNFAPQTTPFTNDANTILLFHFDEGSGTDVVDSSSNPITMVASGTPPAGGWVTGPVELPSGGGSRSSAGARTNAGARSAASSRSASGARTAV